MVDWGNGDLVQVHGSGAKHSAAAARSSLIAATMPSSCLNTKDPAPVGTRTCAYEVQKRQHTFVSRPLALWGLGFSLGFRVQGLGFRCLCPMRVVACLTEKTPMNAIQTHASVRAHVCVHAHHPRIVPHYSKNMTNSHRLRGHRHPQQHKRAQIPH